MSRGFLESLVGRRVRPTAHYAGALASRLTADWVTAPLSADAEVRWNLSTLRARSRELVRNTAFARRYVHHVAHNVAGPEGVALQAQFAGVMAQRRTEQRWAEWGEVGTATVCGTLSWVDVQRLVMRTLPADGEVLIRMVSGADNRFGFALQLLDADQLDEGFSRPAEPGRNAIQMGIELDGWGRPVAYHLWAQHPSEPMGRVRQVVPADQIIHLGDPMRPQQTRYVPWFASVMLEMNMLRGYYEAELVAARLAATQSGFFTRTGENEGVGFDPAQRKLTMEAEPGLFTELDPGLQFEPWSPTHPTEAFGEFSKAMLRSIAAGLGISYSALSQDLSDVNFSSIRAGILDERDVYRALQTWLIAHLHTRVYRAWVRMAMLAGVLDSRLDQQSYHAVQWHARGWAWVDPEKDARAAMMAVEHGLDSRTRQAARQGRDFYDVIRERAAEEAFAQQLGVTLRTRTEPRSKPDIESAKAAAPHGNGRRW